MTNIVQIVPTHRRLPLSSRDNLALCEGITMSATGTLEVTDCDFTGGKGFDAPRDEKPAIGEHVGWLILLLVLYGVAWASIGFAFGYALAGGWR